MKIAVIGGGNGGYAAAADLTFHGHKIFFWQRSIKNTKELIKNNNTIIMQDHNGKKKVKIYKVCTTLEQAVKNVKIVIILLPAFTQKEISKKIFIKKKILTPKSSTYITIATFQFGNASGIEIFAISLFKFVSLIFTFANGPLQPCLLS